MFSNLSDLIDAGAAMASSAIEKLPGDTDAQRDAIASERAALAADTRGQATGNMATRVVSLVVALTVGAIVASFLLPIAINELTGVDTTGWGDGASSLWAILDMIIVLAVFLFFIGIALASTDNL